MRRVISVLLSFLIIVSTGVVFAEDGIINRENNQITKMPMRELKTEADKEDVEVFELSSGNTVIIDVSTDDFFVDEQFFTISVIAENGKDLHSMLELEVTDDEGNIVATQKSVRYEDVYGSEIELLYTMELIQNVSQDKNYIVNFKYGGKYELEYYTDTEIYVITEPKIKSVESVDYILNSYKLTLANVSEGDIYKLYYKDNTYDQLIEKTGTVDSNKSVTVQFEGTPSDNADIYLCPQDVEDYHDNFDRVDLYDVYIRDDGYGGIYVDEYISTTDETVWVGLSEKGYGDIEYTESDVDNISCYMIDTVTGETVTTLSDKEYYKYDSGYSQINVTLSVDKQLDDTHKYIIVCDDGETLRICDNFEVISTPKIYDTYFFINANDEMSTYEEDMPSGIKKFYTNISFVNISDLENVKIELFDNNGNCVAQSKYVSNNRFETTAQKPIEAGEYNLKVTYEDNVYSEKLIFSEYIDENSIYQYINDCIEYNGKIYMCVTVDDASLNFENLRYVIKKEDGTEIEAQYGRKLYDEGNRTYITVIADATLEYGDTFSLQLYDGDTYISPTYPGNMETYIDNITDSSFTYSVTSRDEEGVKIYGEGFSNESKYIIYGMDDISGMEQGIEAVYDANENILRITKSELEKINSILSIGEYNENEYFAIEQDGEYISYIELEGVSNIIFKSIFGFSRYFTKMNYDVLNLPLTEYEYYKIASTEEELSNESYLEIKSGILYQLPDIEGNITVYAQFKDKNGQESDVMKTTIFRDTTKPNFEITELNDKMYINEYGALEIRIGLTADDIGNFWCEFYDKNGNMISFSQKDVKTGENTISINSYVDGYENATKLVCYLEDIAGNKSEKQEFAITVINRYSEYESDLTYMMMDTTTGNIIRVDSSSDSIYIPSEINGVTVTGIGEDVFAYNDTVTSIIMPQSITSIENNAFNYCDNLTKIYYLGTEEQWGNISIGTGNDILTTAEKIYNSEIGISEAAAKYTENGVEVTASALAPEGSDFYAVGYSEDIMTGMSKIENGTAVLPNDTQNVKIIVWDNLGTMKPVCEAKMIEVVQ